MHPGAAGVRHAEVEGADVQDAVGVEDGVAVDEARKARVQGTPYRPTKEEIAEHRCTHWPFRSWCRHCVRARAVSSPHKRRTPEDIEFLKTRVPTVSVGHCFMSAADEAASKNPFLVLYDNDSGSIYAFATGTKAVKQWMVRYVHSIICELGYAQVKIGFKSDRAPELIQLQQEVSRLREAPTVPLLSATKESKSNGDMERAVRTWEGQYRTLKIQAEEETGAELPSGHVLLEWCAWWAAGILSRFRVGTSGRTPYEIATGHRSKTPIACFGGHILYHKKRSIANLGKAESEWYDGVYLGMSGSSSYIQGWNCSGHRAHHQLQKTTRRHAME